MLGNYLKKKLGGDKDVADADKFYSPLRIGLHSTITITTVDWLLMKENLNAKMILPTGSFTVNAIGETSTAGDKFFNIYIMDEKEEEFILQLYCTYKDGNGTIEESTLYKQVVNIQPLTESEWNVNLDAIGYPNLELDDNKYDRIWGDGILGQMDLIEFHEKIVESDNMSNYTNNYMLYSRTFESVLGDEESEILLVGVEESEDTAEIIMMLGLTTPLQNINIQ